MPQAQDIMTREVVTIDGSATIAEAMAKLKSAGVRALIVERRSEEDAYGIITQRDIVYNVLAQGLEPADVQVHEVHSKPLLVVNRHLDVRYVARLMASMGLSRAPVIYDGKIQGIIALSDIVAAAG